MRKTTVRFVLPTFAAAALLAGCGAAEDQTTPSSSAAAQQQQPQEQQNHNDADVRFAQEMIPHHRQAVEMAKLVPSRTNNEQVRELAKAIQQAQDPEIQRMTGWLERWGAEVPGEHAGHGGMSGMPGMMPADNVAALAASRGDTFDREWLRVMIEHHEGAIEMSRAELANGSDPEAKTLAQEIIDAQQAEIDTMNALLR